MKSTDKSFGTVAITIHWVSAVLILVLLVTGFRAALTEDAAAKAAILRVHIPVAITILLLTLARLSWWAFWDTKPQPMEMTPNWQEVAGKWTHKLLYLVILLMLGSGIALSVLSGAPDAIFGSGQMPDFTDFAPRLPHGVLARILLGLIVLHAGAALFHHFVQKDDTLKRIWFGRKTS